MSRGMSSPIWMNKAAIYRVPQNYLVKAMADLFDWLDEVDYREPLDAFEIMDRLVQVATTGEYKAPAFNVYERAGHEDPADRPLTDEEQKIMDRFEQQLMNLPDAEEDEDDELPESN